MRKPSATDRQEIIAALSAPMPSISPKYFYDQRGSELFEAITRVPEYYLTRTESEILATHAEAITAELPPRATIIEPGAGNCEKAGKLCRWLRPQCFVAVDISAEFIAGAARRLQYCFPEVTVHSLVADIDEDVRLPPYVPTEKRVVFYPGSSIGNFDPADALALLRRMRSMLNEDGALLCGVDLVKDVAVLEAAYNDAAGVTAEFNLNALAHLNRLVGSDFATGDWRHLAFFNARNSRIEMHLEARRSCIVRWPGGERHFSHGERIHTENSYKYAADGFASLLDAAGFHRTSCWTDPARWFAVFLARA